MANNALADAQAAARRRVAEVTVHRGSELGRLAVATKRLDAAMRTHGLPSPPVAARALAGWSLVTAFALYFQVQARGRMRAPMRDQHIHERIASCFAPATQPSWQSIVHKWRGEE